jgi:hypothetical protein
VTDDNAFWPLRNCNAVALTPSVLVINQSGLWQVAELAGNSASPFVSLADIAIQIWKGLKTTQLLSFKNVKLTQYHILDTPWQKFSKFEA